MILVLNSSVLFVVYFILFKLNEKRGSYKIGVLIGRYDLNYEL
jgi:hypothetical protein